MGLRTITKFCYKGKPECAIYRHWGTTPESGMNGLPAFFDEVEKLDDTRFNDPSYLAAKFVVWLADQHQNSDNKLNFISVGVIDSNVYTEDNPSDIDFFYIVDCDKKSTMNSKWPAVTAISTDENKTVVM